MFSFHKFFRLSVLPFNKIKCQLSAGNYPRESRSLPQKKDYCAPVGRSSQLSMSRCAVIASRSAVALFRTVRPLEERQSISSCSGSLVLGISLHQRYTRLAFHTASRLLTSPKKRSVVCADRPPSAGESKLLDNSQKRSLPSGTINPLQNSYKANDLQTETLASLVSKDRPLPTTSAETIGLGGPIVSLGMAGSSSVRSQGSLGNLVEDPTIPLAQAASPPSLSREEMKEATSIGDQPTNRSLEALKNFQIPSGTQNVLSPVTQKAARRENAAGPFVFLFERQNPKVKVEGSVLHEATPLFPAKQEKSRFAQQTDDLFQKIGSSSLREEASPAFSSSREGRRQLAARRESSSPFEEKQELAKQSTYSRSAIDKKAYPQKDRSRRFEGNTNNSNSDSSATLKQSALSRVVSITYEEIGLFPRSFSRVLDRFLKQVFSDVENLVIQEYRFYRYLFLTTLKCLFIFIFVPVFVNFLAKTYIVRPLTEYFWNTKQTEIFLNYYQQKRAFAELKDFEEKIYFESLIYPKSAFSFHSQSKAIKDLANPLVEQGYERHLTLPSEVRDSLREEVAPTSLRGAVLPFGTERSESGKNKGFASLGRDNSSSTEMKMNRTFNTASKEDVLAPFAANFNQLAYPALQPVANQDQKSGCIAGKGRVVSTVVDALSGASSASLWQPPSAAQIQKHEVESFTNESSPYILSSLPSSVVGVSPEGRHHGVASSRRETESLINSYTLKSSLFVYQTKEADKNIQQRYQEKTIELAQRYNDESIEAITNFFADLISLGSLFYLLYALEIQINITKSFLLEVFFGLDDSKKSLLILLVTDLLVGYHSSNLWELFFESLFHHYGLPESQTGIFLLVATLPVLLDVLFKYLIFRHLNRSSPATVATYHAMIE